MSDLNLHVFLVCVVHAGEPQSDLAKSMDTVEIEPHNLLLNELNNAVDGPDLTSEEAARVLKLLMETYADVFIDELPSLPPPRPINEAH